MFAGATKCPMPEGRPARKAPLAPEHSPTEYKDVLLFLATAGVVVPLFGRLKISPVLGFLTVGAVLGPFGLGALAERWPVLGFFTISDAEQARVLGELGVVFLLFSIGLELSWERLRRMRRMIFGLGLAQIVLCGAAIAGGLYAFGAAAPEAGALGAALALSSTAIVVPLLAQAHRLQTPSGRMTFGTLLAQDLALAPLLFVVGFFSGSLGDAPLPRLAATLVSGAVGMALIVLVGRTLMRPMLRSVAKSNSEELFVAASLLVVIVAALASQAAGLSMALGAFVAGVLLAETEFRREVEVTLEPFKGLLLGLFFVSVGLGLNVGVLLERPVVVLGLLAGSVAIKVAIVFGLARVFGAPSRRALEVALSLGPAGEFAFVILGETAAAGRPGSLTEAALVAVTLSMFLIPLLTRLGARLGDRPADADAPAPAFESPDAADAPRVIVCGYGRVGRLVGEMLAVHETPWIAIDSDIKIVEAARKEGVPIFYGDTSRPGFLDASGAGDARAVVLTMSGKDQIDTVVKLIRERWPDLPLIARARDARHAARLYELGVTDAVPETVEASLQLAENTLVDIGVPMGPVIASIHERREQYRNLFRAKIEGDREPRALGTARAARQRAKAETSSQADRPVGGEL